MAGQAGAVRTCRAPTATAHEWKAAKDIIYPNPHKCSCLHSLHVALPWQRMCFLRRSCQHAPLPQVRALGGCARRVAACMLAGAVCPPCT